MTRELRRTTSSRALPSRGAKCGPMKPIPFQGSGPEPLPPEPDMGGASHSGLTASRISASATATAQRESAATQRLLGSSADQEMSHLTCCSALSWDERLMGFVGCYAIGFSMTLTSIFSFPALLVGHPTPFAFKYSVGNLLGLASSVRIPRLGLPYGVKADGVSCQHALARHIPKGCMIASHLAGLFGWATCAA